MQLGERVQLENGRSVQVFGYEPETVPSNPFSTPERGKVFSAIDVEGCTGGTGSATGLLNPFYFTLALPDGSRAQTSIPVKEPALSVGPQKANECQRGYVTYQVREGVKPTAVVLVAPELDVVWKL